MIVRLTVSAALHATAGVAMGVGGVLAACTVAQVARKVVDHAPSKYGMPQMPNIPPSPYTPTPVSARTDNTGPDGSGTPGGDL